MRKNIFAPPPLEGLICAVDYITENGSSPTCAIDAGTEAKIRLEIPRRLGAVGAECCFFDEYISKTLGLVRGELIKAHKDREEYIFDISSLAKAPALFFFYFKIKTACGDIFVKKGVKPYFSYNEQYGEMFQITVSDFAHPAPDSMLGGIIYHIFVDRFRRGGEVEIPEGARLVFGEWENIPEFPEYPGAPLKNNTFYGGTLFGIIEKLDYLKTLGVSAIYLSPIFSSVSNHKYDTADYMTVDEMFGGEEALGALICACEEKDIKIILDGVFNHTGDDSIYFNKYSRFSSLGAYNSTSSPYYPWYQFKNHPDEYVCWWDIPILPRINPDIPECGEFIAGSGGVIEKYRNLGIYGFRLDVADELSDEFLSKIKSKLSEGGENILYGEVWEDASSKIAYGKRKKYYLGRELDGVMNYPVRVGLIDYIVNKSESKLYYALNTVLYNTPKRIRDLQMNLIGSHDTPRALSALSGVSSEGKTNEELCYFRLSAEDYERAKARLMSAYTILATIPGIPSVFYGDEAGLEGYSDPFCRMPYPWGKEDFELLDHYKLIGKIRRENEVYRDGEFKLLSCTKDLLIFERSKKNEYIYTIYNNSSKELKLKLSSKAKTLFTNKTALSVTLCGEESAVIKANRILETEIVSEDLK